MRIVTCFAPPLDDTKRNNYKQLFAQTKGPLRQALNALSNAIDRWWDIPESKGAKTKHALVNAEVIALDDETRKAVNLPSLHEIAELLETIAPGPLRNAAFHLLWHAKELELGREPITLDKVK